MQKNSIERLSKLAVPLKSKGRFFKEKKTHLRTDFQRDRDRIIHSTAFRRLKHKTQVFINTSGDHFRTRITHSLEVAQISRTLSKFFNLNEDLCETLSLAHDLGHTPFGHAGEEELNNCMKKFGGFDEKFKISGDYDFLLRVFNVFEGKIIYLNSVSVIMRYGGVSSGNYKNTFRKWKEDFIAIKQNNVGSILTVFFKRIIKLAMAIKEVQVAGLSVLRPLHNCIKSRSGILITLSCNLTEDL